MLYFISPMAKTLSTNIQNFCHWPTNKLHSGIVEKKMSLTSSCLQKRAVSVPTSSYSFKPTTKCGMTQLSSVVNVPNLRWQSKDHLPSLAAKDFAFLNHGEAAWKLDVCRATFLDANRFAQFQGLPPFLEEKNVWLIAIAEAILNQFGDVKAYIHLKSRKSSHFKNYWFATSTIQIDCYDMLWYVTIIYPGTVKTDAS